MTRREFQRRAFLIDDIQFIAGEAHPQEFYTPSICSTAPVSRSPSPATAACDLETPYTVQELFQGGWSRPRAARQDLAIGSCAENEGVGSQSF
jgi:hypothetical protein